MKVACLALIGGTLFTPEATLEGKVVVVRGETIEAIADAPPPDCELVDAAGGVITAGFVDVWTDLGIVEVPLEPHSADDNHAGGEHASPTQINAAFRVADGYNPRSSKIAVARRGGITAAVAVPGGGTISGQSAWVEMAGTTQTQSVRSTSVAMHAGLGGSERSRAATLATLRRSFEEARFFANRVGDWNRARTRPPGLPVADLAALKRVLAREIPLVVRTDRASDIEAMLRLAADLDIRLIVAGGAEAWLVAEALAQKKVPVIVDPTIYGPTSFDSIHARRDNARRLQAAGVPVILSAFWGANARTLPQLAGNTVREGLSREAALAAVTSTPAEAFGRKNDGRLSAGKRANLVIWSGDPFELSSYPTTVLIGGVRRSLASRQTKLRDRYLRGDGTGIPQPLSLP